MNQPDIDRWAERMAGRASSPTPAEDPLLEAARRAVRAEDDAARAEGAADVLGRARLLKRLEAEKLLDDKPRTAKWRPPTWLAMVAALGVVAIGVRLGMEAGARRGPLPEGIEIARGLAGTVSLQSTQPAAEAARVISQLRALGFAPKQLDRPGRVMLEVSVATRNLADFRAWAEPRGGHVMEAGTYRIFIDAPAAR